MALDVKQLWSVNLSRGIGLDAVKKTVVDAFNAGFRKFAFLATIGGKDFGILFELEPDTSEECALSVAEKAHRAFERESGKP